MSEIKYTLLKLEEVKYKLHPAFQDAADDIIERYDTTGEISEYEFNLATNFVMMVIEND